MVQSRGDHFSRINRAGRQSSFKKDFAGNDFVFCVQENHLEAFTGFVSHTVIKMVEQFL